MADDKKKPKEGSAGFLKWIILQIKEIDENVALYLLVGFAIIFAAVMSLKTGVDPQALQSMALFVARVVGIGAVVLIIYRKLKDKFIVSFALHTIVGAALLYFVLGFVQLVSGNFFIPQLQTAACFIEPRQNGCILSPSYSGTAVAQATLTELPPVPDAIVAANPDPNTGGDEMPLIVMAQPPETPVYVQFAGAMTRESVVQATNELWELGWNMVDQENASQRGGERTGVAQNLNEVRYFRAEDRADAEWLARSYAETVDWVSPEAFGVRDMSALADQVGPEGLFEIWTSQN